MAGFTDWIVPAVIGGVLLFGLVRGVNIFDSFIEGAKEGLGTAWSILPALVLLLTAVSVFKVSGMLDVLTWALSPAAGLLGVPREVLPLALLRPVSGSGSMVVFRDILASYGPDSFIGRVASVLQGATETTFYTIAVYFGATGVKKTRHTLASSMTADLAALVISAVAVRLLLGGH